MFVDMKVLYDHQIFQIQKFGGISRYFNELISRVAVRPDIEASVFAGLHINQYGIEKHRNRFKHYFGVNRPAVRKTGKMFSAANNMLFRLFVQNARPQLIHETYYAPSISAAKVPRVTTVHDMIYELFPHDFAKYDSTSKLKRRAVNHAERVIAVSQSTKRDLVELFHIPEKKVDVIHLANSLTQMAGPTVMSSPYLLYVGGRSGYKNFELALEAFSRSTKLSRDFMLIAFGAAPFSNTERSSIRSKGLENRVHYDSGSDERLAALYSHAELLIYPSLYEGFGLPILEAMHFGCPVICGNASSIPEVAGEAGAYFDPKSADSLIARIESIAYDSSERQKYSELGIQQESRFSWDRCAQQTSTAYHSM